MAQSRNEYLQSLLKMRDNYQSQGNPLINREDDNGNVGNELSAFAYMKTPQPSPEQSIGDVAKRVVDTGRSTINSLNKGFFSFLDGIFDFVTTTIGAITGTVGGVISLIGEGDFKKGWNAGTDWAEEAVTYDWASVATNFLDKTAGWMLSLPSENSNYGKVAVGQDEAQEELQAVNKSGYIEKATPYLEMAGEILPSIAIMGATYGAGLTHANAINAGVAGAGGMGQGMETAVKETGNFGGKELLYAGAKGAIAYGTTFALGKMGSNVGQQGKVSQKIASAVGKRFGENAEVITGVVSNVIEKSALAFGRSVATQSVEPFTKAIYDDGEAIEQAYGDSAKTSEYFKQMMGNATVSAVIAGTMQAVSTGASIKQSGSWAEYKKVYYINKNHGADLVKAKQFQDEYNKIVKDLKKDLNIKDIKSKVVGDDVLTAKNLGEMAVLNKKGLVSDEAFEKACQKANARFLALQKKYDKFLTKVQKAEANYQGYEQEAVNNSINNLKGSVEYTNSSAEAQRVLSAFWKTRAIARKYGYQRKEGFKFWDKNGGGSYTVNDDNVYYEASDGSVAKMNFENDHLVFDTPHKDDLPSMINVLGNRSNDLLPKTGDIPSHIINIPSVSGINKELTLTAKISAKILNRPNSKEVLTFLQKGLSKIDNNYVLTSKDDGHYLVVEPYNDGNAQKYGLITINPKTNEITDINISKTLSYSQERYFVEPKKDIDKVMNTKLENEDGTAKTYVALEDKNVLGGWAVTPAGADAKDKFFVYAKKPLKETELAQKLPFAKMAKKFNIPTSLEKTYLRKLSNSDPLSVIKFISKYAKADEKTVLAKLGYDAFEYKNGNVIVNDANQIVTGDVKYGEAKGNNDYSRIAERIGRKSANEKFKGYLGENGKKLTSKKAREEFTQLVLDNHAYRTEVGRNGKYYVLNKQAYTQEMLDIVGANKKIGAQTRFVIDYNIDGGDYELEGIIYHLLNYPTSRNFDTRNLHEVCHYLDEEWHMGAITDVYSLLDTWKQTNPEEYNKYYTLYASSYKNTYEQDESWETAIQKELLAEVYSKHIKISDSALQDKIIGTVEMTKKLGKAKADSLFMEFSEKDDFKPLFLTVEKTPTPKVEKEVRKNPKIISDLKAKSSAVLIEAGADVSKGVKYRLQSVKDAFDTAIAQLITDKTDADINFVAFEKTFGDVKQNFAELNLARPKDREIATNNLINNVLSTQVKIDGEKFELRDIVNEENEGEIKEIILNAFDGKAEPTKLAKWANSLNLQKIKTQQSIRSFKLMTRIKNKIKSGTVNYFSSPTDAVGELTLYDKIIEDVKLPFTNESLTNLVKNVGLYYTEEQFGKMLSNFDIPFNSFIPQLNEMLNSTIVKGKPLTAQQITLANDILQSVYNDLKDLGKGVISKQRDMARKGVVLAQALQTEAKDGIGSKIINAIKTIDQSIRSPISVTGTWLGEQFPLVSHLRDNGKACGNAKRKQNDTFMNSVFKDTGIKRLDKALAKKVTFKGREITTAQALKVLGVELTRGEDFYKRGGSWTVGGKRVDFKVTPEEIEELKSNIAPNVLKWKEERVDNFFNNDGKEYVMHKFKTMNGFELPTPEGSYYPTSAVGDKIADIKVSHSGSISPADWGLSFLKERVSHSDAPFNLDGDIVKDVSNYIDKITRWGEWAEWYHTLRIMENARVFGQGTSLNAIMEKSVYGWKEMMDFVHHTVLGIPYDNSQNLLGKLDNAIGSVFQNFQSVAMMDIFTQTKTSASDFTGYQYFGMKTALKGQINYYSQGGLLAESKASKIITELSPTLANRKKTSEAFTANTGKNLKSKTAKVLTSVVRGLDWHIHCKAFFTAQVKAKEEGYGDFWTDSNNERAVRILEEYSDTTQPTTTEFNVGMYRAGANGKIIKQLFGMFQSMGQNIWQGLVRITVGWRAGVKRVKAYENASAEHEEKIKEYRAKEEEAEKRMNNTLDEEEYNEAKKEYEEAKFHREGHERSKADVDEELAREKATYTAKNWVDKASAYLVGLVGSGVILTLISKLKKKTYGKEEWDGWDIKEMSETAVYQSFVNWIPYVGTIANSIKNDSDLTIFTVDNMNKIIKSFKDVYSSIKEGDAGHIAGSTLSALTTLSAFFGIPAQSMWNLINGVWYNADHGSNIAFRNWLGMLSGTYLRTQYKGAYTKGQQEKAIANLEVWTSNYSIKTSRDVLNEIYRLNREGEANVAPSAIKSSYTNEKGEEIAFTSAQIRAFRQEYSKADESVSKLLKLEDYKKQDNKTKASLMRRLYSAYHESAQAKATGIAPNSKLAKLLYYTNGDLDMAKYIMSLQNLSVIKEDKKHTRKENVLNAINKIVGLNRNEKLLLAYLSGYSVSEKNQKAMVNFLISKGFKPKVAKEFLGVK